MGCCKTKTIEMFDSLHVREIAHKRILITKEKLRKRWEVNDASVHSASDLFPMLEVRIREQITPDGISGMLFSQGKKTGCSRFIFDVFSLVI